MSKKWKQNWNEHVVWRSCIPIHELGRLESSMGRGKLDQLSLMHRIPVVNRENLDSHKLSSDLSMCKLGHECYTQRHRHTH